MKFVRTFFAFILLILLPYILNSCGEDTVTPKTANEFSVQNLKPLNTAVDGMYEAWVSIETNGDHEDANLRTIGKFNVSSKGSLIDKNGNSFQISLSHVPDVTKISDAIVTIEPPEDENDTIPSESRLMGGIKVSQNGTLTFNLSMNYSEVLGTKADQIDNAPEANYVLSAPTTGDTNQYKRGAWFSSNISGTIAGLQLPVIPDTLGWWYQAWIVDSTASGNLQFYNMGRFTNANGPDDFDPGCNDTIAAPWNLPGQDWIKPNCPSSSYPPITDLTIGKYKILVTLEPRSEQGTALQAPFFMTLYQNKINGQSYGTINNLSNIFDMPGGFLKISVQ